ncbi:MAG TPA: hypothetical protein VK985_07075 [Rariglobus sp.]|nr:hypothetical protein [Rariglobus sp.]
MKSFLLTGLLAFASCTSVFSQDTAAATTPNLIGKRYVETQFSYIDYSGSSDFALGTAFNQPLNASFDAGAAFVHTQEEGNDSHNYQVFGLNLTGHHDFGKTRAFARGTINYEWWSVKNLWWYQADVGLERALCDRVLFTAYVSWLDFFSSTFIDSSISGTAKLTYWATPEIGLSAAASMIERGAVAGRLGVAFVF